LVERLSTECTVGKPKTKQLLWPITADQNNPMNQSKLEVKIHVTGNKCRKTGAGKLRSVWFYFCLVEKVARFFGQSQNIVKPKQTRITFETQLKTGPM